MYMYRVFERRNIPDKSWQFLNCWYLIRSARDNRFRRPGYRNLTGKRDFCRLTASVVLCLMGHRSLDGILSAERWMQRRRQLIRKNERKIALGLRYPKTCSAAQCTSVQTIHPVRFCSGISQPDNTYTLSWTAVFAHNLAEFWYTLAHKISRNQISFP